MIISQAQKEDSRALASIHAREINQSFLSQLGTGFLTVLYDALIDWERTVCLVAKDGDDVAGFISGCEDAGAFYRRFLRTRSGPALAAALPHMWRPTIIRGVVAHLNRGRAKTDALPLAELLSLAVSRDQRHSGVGRRLMHGFAVALSERGIETFKVAAGADLAGANSFYSAMGLERTGETELLPGGPSIIYIGNTVKLGGRSPEARETADV